MSTKLHQNKTNLINVYPLGCACNPITNKQTWKSQHGQSLAFITPSRFFNNPEVFETMVGKGENTGK